MKDAAPGDLSGGQAERSFQEPRSRSATGGTGRRRTTDDAGDHPAYAAVGFGGQLIEVLPDLQLVVVASTVVTGENTLESDFFQLMTATAIVPALE